MEGAISSISYSVGILIISDTVSRGEKVDLSGANLLKLMKSGIFPPISSVAQECVGDEMNEIQRVLIQWVDEENIDFILTVGGTGFSPRDVTPEATRAVIDREAPHLAAHMILGCCEKSKFSVLSRSVCGMRGRSLILNLPGSKKGSEECFEMVASIIPHALDQLKSATDKVAADHLKIQAEHRIC